MNQVAARPPTFPGLLPDAEALMLADSFQTHIDGLELVVDRMPTAIDRQILARRSAAIDEALRPVSETGRAPAAEVIAGLLVGYGYIRNDPHAEQTITVYVKHLETIPLFAVRAACEDVKGGRVFDIDQRTGNRRPISPDKEPSTVRLRMVAQKHVDALKAEQWRFDKVLRAKRAVAAPASEEERRRVAELFKGLQASLTAGVATEDVERAAELARKAEEGRRARDQEIVAEYVELGIEPMKIAGVLISPELARQQRMYSRKVSAEESDED